MSEKNCKIMSTKHNGGKPYTTPPGYVPPTLGEQWRYFYKHHPYYRYGYSAVILLGLVGYVASQYGKKETGGRSVAKPLEK